MAAQTTAFTGVLDHPSSELRRGKPQSRKPVPLASSSDMSEFGRKPDNPTITLVTPHSLVVQPHLKLLEPVQEGSERHESRALVRKALGIRQMTRKTWNRGVVGSGDVDWAWIP